MIIKKKKVTDAIFLILWAIYSTFYIICKQSEFVYMYDLDNIFLVVSIAVSVGLILHTFSRNRFSTRRIILILCTGGVFALTIIYLRDAYMLVLFSFLIAGYNIDITKLVRFDFRLRICQIIFIVSLSLIGVINNYSAVINGVYKQALGFGHPNTLAAMVFVALIEWLYLRYDRLKWYDIVGIIGCCIVISNVAAGRSSMYSFFFVFLFVMVLKVWPGIMKSRLFKYACSSLVSALTVISFFLVWMYNKGNIYAVALNSLLSNRLYAASNVFNAYGLSIMGQTVSTYGTRSESSSALYFSVDMSYIYIPIRYGVVILAFFCLGYFFYTKKVIEKGNAALLISILFFVLMGFMESYIYRISFNFSLLAMLSYIAAERPENKRKIRIRIRGK